MGCMRAIEIRDQQLIPVERPEPDCAEGEILLDVLAAGVNRADLMQVAGNYPPPPGASDLPGLEVCGRRRDTGELAVALLAGGGYAETVAVHPDLLLPVPEGIDPVDAAGIVEVCATVVSNLVIEAQLQQGETVLIHGASGGVGVAAVQIATRLGARVFASVGSDEAAATVREIGADEAWNRHEVDVQAAAKEAGGVDVILDVLGGGEALAKNIKALRPGGRLVVIALMDGAKGELPVGLLMVKRLRVIGTTLRSRPLAEKREILQATREIAWPGLADGSLRIPVHARFPLTEAASAHEVLETGGHLGKVVLTVQD